jgi:hypothetical protein
MPWGAKPAGRFGSVNEPLNDVRLKFRSRTSIFSTIEIRRQKKGVVDRRQTLINRAAGGVIESHACRVACASPAGDEAIFSVKNELPAIEISTVSVRYVARGTAGAAITVRIVRRPGDGHYEAGIPFCPDYHREWKCRCCYWRSRILAQEE